jgi:arsenate reductase-like glutaredoxin family protein
VPSNEFFNHFRCKGKTNNIQVLTNEAIDSELFTILPQRSYQIKTIVIPNSDNGRCAFPIFESGNKAKDKTINQIIKMSVENDGIFDLEYIKDWHGIIRSETVVANEFFLCIHVVVGSCGNTCHQHTVSVNIDLRKNKRMTNCELLALMGLSAEKFEDMVRNNWRKIRITNYDDKYPTFKDVDTPNDESETDEVEGQNRYTTDFNETLQEASILPVVYKNKKYLRLGFNIATWNRTKLAFLDIELHPN